MNDTAFRTAPITLDRRLVLGGTAYQVTSFPAEDDRFDLCVVSSDPEGHVVSELSAGITPSDLPGLTDVLTSTLAGLLAMTQPSSSSARDAPPPERRHPNQGTRWTPDDDDRLLTRYREGARPRDLMAEFGRSNGGIRARLEYLGELAPGARWHTRATPSASAAQSGTPATSLATPGAPSATPAAPSGISAASLATPGAPSGTPAAPSGNSAASLATPGAPSGTPAAPSATPAAPFVIPSTPSNGAVSGEAGM
ncbi:hypothetical protein ACQP2X_08420 [Actinoplanes sp. CA-131856]